TVSGNEIIKQLVNNYVINGFLLHAFNSANLESILKNGLDPRNRLFKEEREILNLVARYDYEATSNKLYVTGNYRVLYSYGSLSPEWVYYFLKDSKVMYDKNFNKAYEQFMETAKKKLSCPDRLKLAEDAAKKVFQFYLRDNLNIQIAVLDKFAKNERNELIFKSHRYEEDEVNLDDYLKEVTEKQYDENDVAEIKKDMSKIIRDFSPHERCAFTQFTKEDFALIELPPFKEFEKLKVTQPEH
ncbi:MAG: hypothetical protein CVV59_01305, partial [Tenericutes bacterium HGW-Tenericutes-4]